MDSSEATTSHHCAQIGSNTSKVRTLNNAIRKTSKIRNKYKNVRAARIDFKLKNRVNIPVSSSKSASSINSSITLAHYFSLVTKGKFRSSEFNLKFNFGFFNMTWFLGPVFLDDMHSLLFRKLYF
jgi:hypothetical protein